MQGEAFIGAAGGLLNARILPMAGLKREQVKVDNCVRCRPPNDWLAGAPWQFAALTHCRQYLQESLDAPELQVVVTLGDTALRSVLDLWGTDGVRVQDFHGTRHRDPSGRFWVVPTYHPSHLQRGAINLLDVVRFDIEVGRGLLNKGGFAPRPVSLVLDPPVERFRSWAAVVIQRALADAGGTWLAVDIETPDKEGGRDEGELSTEDRSTQIDRCNFSVDGDEGWTVPYVGPYIEIIDSLLNCGAWLLMWNKWYDESRLRFEGRHKFIDPQGNPVIILDLMWLAHHYQSDWPLGLGFWAPFASDYGAWKHLGKSEDRANKVIYAAVDGFQTRRVADYLVERAMKLGLWDAFYRHTHLREQFVLRPAHELGCPISVERLDKFHEKLQAASAERLALIQASEMAGTLRPKAGYAKRPKGATCGACDGTGTGTSEDGGTLTAGGCQPCGGTGELAPLPPKSILGKSGEKGDNAKQQYMEEGVQLVEREIQVTTRVCRLCSRRVSKTPHTCPQPKRRKRGDLGSVDDLPGAAIPVDAADLVETVAREIRYFWQLPFNPDSSQQILAFIKGAGLEPGRAKKTRKETADKETLKKLAKTTGNPVYTYLLEYKAVKKVDSTYAVGAKRRIWSDGRLHPFYTFRPSTLRDSYVNPNIQNVVADKDKKGVGSLAAGFRDCIVADPGYRLVEIDYSGIEGIITGWLSGDPNYVRLATLGVHAYLSAYLLHDSKQLASTPDLKWSDADLAACFSDVKKRFPEMYDKAKRCVHGCLTEDHEVLTPNGWVPISTLEEGTPVAQWQEGHVDFVTPSRITRSRAYDPEPMVQLTGRGLRVQMTAGHRVPLRIGATERVQEVAAADLPRCGRIPVTGQYTGGHYAWSAKFALLVAGQADGQLQRQLEWTFHLVRPRKIARLTTLLQEAGVEYSMKPCSCHPKGVRIRYKLNPYPWLTPEKTFSLAAWLRLSPSAQHKFLAEVLEWDGTVRQRHGVRAAYLSTEKSNVEVVQTIAHLAGRQGLLRERPPSDGSYGTRMVYEVSLNRRRWARLECMERTRVPKPATVYCVTVPSGYFMVRWQDTVSVTGNTNYGLTSYGMHNNFPEVFPTLKDAEKVLDMYFALCPKLPEYHSRMRDHAYKNGFIGGSYVDDYTLLTSGGHHPWGYIHWFYGVMSFRPLNETSYRRLQWIAKNRMNRTMHPRVAIIHNRPFEKVMGEDSKRVIAFPPQSIAAGMLKEAALTLFHPDSPDYIGNLAEGKTPLIAPIHDSFLLHVPDHVHEWLIMHCAEVMRRPIPTMPLPAEWNMGTHLRVNVAAKVSPVGGSWAECDDVKLPEMAAETARETLYTPVDENEWEEVEDLQVGMAPVVREVA